MKLGLVFGAFALVVAACAAAQEQAWVASYAQEQQTCVSSAKSRAEADACRARVKDRWCGPGGALRDAGACAYDGGHE